ADSQLLTIRELTRAVQTVRDLLPERRERADSIPQPPQVGIVARLFGVGRLAEYQRRLAQYTKSQRISPAEAQTESSAQISRILESALAGLSMGSQRMERILRQFELEPISTIGQQFDPERMEAVEVVAGSDRQTGEVVGELRRGYQWKGKVFRFAQVRVAK